MVTLNLQSFYKQGGHQVKMNSFSPIDPHNRNDKQCANIIIAIIVVLIIANVIVGNNVPHFEGTAPRRSTRLASDLQFLIFLFVFVF